jgi:hypothetical protein
MSYTVTLMVSEEALLMFSLKSELLGLGYAPTSNKSDAMAAGTMGTVFSVTWGIATVELATVTGLLSETGVVCVPLANPEPIETVDGEDMQPTLLLAVMLHIPETNPLNTPLRLV